ncbi:SDR family oxidoreductase [Candidatus Viridilinea mediisalina]|uniref:Short-chain dehydrogenase n=1 Tax=Candidatus Viridilinea mediisalina TaxID=2024553 RepID=A0A2A6RHL4_9CHLR|nr:SDR family oxidoreductase [Candidatus Viridilinea mediisalina]PDW02386.1 short-chain dehydrogenase [Candidatus Viridilinea mediisalina]
MNGKVCLVTGASSGIGQVAALELARMGATVVLLVRNRQRGEAARQAMIGQTGNPNVDLLVADFAALDTVRQAATEFLGRYQRLDVLLNNAGVYVSERRLSADGFELTFAVNHLAPFLLTNLLLDCMQATGAARVVTVSSGAHMAGSAKFNDVRAERGYNGFRAYADSKLANVLFTYELARRLEHTNVTANCLHPGGVRTNFAADATGLFRVLFNLARPLMLSPEQGAQTSIYLASSPEVAGVNGKYFANCRAQTSSPSSYDHTVQGQLWELSEQLCSGKAVKR